MQESVTKGVACDWVAKLLAAFAVGECVDVPRNDDRVLGVLLLEDTELGDDADVVGREMGIWEAYNLLQVLLIDLSQHRLYAQALVGIPNVVDDTLEARSIVGNWQLRTSKSSRVSALERKAMTHSTLHGHLIRVFAILVGHEVQMGRGEGAVEEVFVDARVGDGIEVAADDGGDSRAVVIMWCLSRFRRLDGFWSGRMR